MELGKCTFEAAWASLLEGLHRDIAVCSKNLEDEEDEWNESYWRTRRDTAKKALRILLESEGVKEDHHGPA